MFEVSPTSLSLAFGAAFIASGLNSVAGGGTMISFPVLIGLGLPPVIANATNTVGIWLGAFGSIWGFRREIAGLERNYFWFLLPAFLGSIVGAWLLRALPGHVFEKAVPWLVLFATCLFAVQSAVQKRVGSHDSSVRSSRRYLGVALVLQFAVAVYGGYFGAGMSIMSLSVLGLLGMTNVLEMSATTSLLAFVINGIAGLCFIWAGLVHWPCVLCMALGALAGGYGGAGLARKIGKVALRRFVVCVGAVFCIVLFARAFRP